LADHDDSSNQKIGVLGGFCMLRDDVQLISVDDHVIEHDRVWIDRLPAEYLEFGTGIVELENPTGEDAEPAFNFFQAMPIPYVEPEDIANLALVLASDESRCITGQQIRVDAGSLLKFPKGPAG